MRWYNEYNEHSITQEADSDMISVSVFCSLKLQYQKISERDVWIFRERRRLYFYRSISSPYTNWLMSEQYWKPVLSFSAKVEWWMSFMWVILKGWQSHSFLRLMYFGRFWTFTIFSNNTRWKSLSVGLLSERKIFEYLSLLALEDKWTNLTWTVY